ncbi:hypothetical protein ACFE04_016160 [Oxalis oulophora]
MGAREQHNNNNNDCHIIINNNSESGVRVWVSVRESGVRVLMVVSILVIEGVRVWVSVRESGMEGVGDGGSRRGRESAMEGVGDGENRGGRESAMEGDGDGDGAVGERRGERAAYETGTRKKGESSIAGNIEASRAGKKRKRVSPTTKVPEASGTDEEDTDDDMPLIARSKIQSNGVMTKSSVDEGSSSQPLQINLTFPLRAEIAVMSFARTSLSLDEVEIAELRSANESLQKRWHLKKISNFCAGILATLVKKDPKAKNKWKLWRSGSEGWGSFYSTNDDRRGHVAPSETSDYSSSGLVNSEAFTAAMATMIRARPKDF